MKLSCYHTHTVFCDGADTVDAMCAAAARKGFSALGFSAHAPLPLPSTWHLAASRLDEYRAAVRAAAEAYRGRLEVYLGLEIDYIEGMNGPADPKWKAAGLDYSIGSVHYLIPPNGAAPFTVDGPYEEWARGVTDGYGGDAEAAAAAYWKAVTAMVRDGGFDFVGHLDLIKKNNRGAGAHLSFDPEGARYREAALEAVEEIAARGTIVEINTGGLNRGSVRECYPSPWLLAELRKRNARIVVNADAHRPEHLDGHYDEARRALRAAGFDSTVMLLAGRWQEETLN